LDRVGDRVVERHEQLDKGAREVELVGEIEHGAQGFTRIQAFRLVGGCVESDDQHSRRLL
jgi:hypothetical protein